MNSTPPQKNDKNDILIIIVVLAILALLFLFFGKPKSGGGGGGGTPTTPAQTPCESPVIVSSEEEPPVSGCPLNGPYTYCSTDTIEKVYIVESCPASTRLVTKLINEGKLTGRDDPKIVRCCKNPDLCPVIRKYPSVTCKATPLDIYEGYCP